MACTHNEIKSPLFSRRLLSEPAAPSNPEIRPFPACAMGTGHWYCTDSQRILRAPWASCHQYDIIAIESLYSLTYCGVGAWIAHSAVSDGKRRLSVKHYLFHTKTYTTYQTISIFRLSWTHSSCFLLSTVWNDQQTGHHGKRNDTENQFSQNAITGRKVGDHEAKNQNDGVKDSCLFSRESHYSLHRRKREYRRTCKSAVHEQ